MSRTLTNSVSPSLLAFKPRQVLLSHHAMKQRNDAQTPKSADEAASLHPEQRTLLLHAVAFFLEHNGFSKTLKKFRSEAQIEKDSSKELLLSLEEMCHKHFKKFSQAVTPQNKPDEEIVTEVTDDRVPEEQEEPAKKSKDKKKIKKNTVADKEKSEPAHVESLKNSNGTEPSEGTTVHEEAGKKSKDKKKKKNKEKIKTVATIPDDVTVARDSQAVDSNGLNGNVATLDEKVVKSKSKKKKDGRHLSDTNSNQLNDGTKMLHEEEHNDNSKKRKRLASEDNDSHDSHAVDDKETEDVKRRKLEGSKGCNDGVLSTKVDVNELSQETDVEKTAEKTSSKKPWKKSSNGSTEPKTINAFQRVKVDAVTFADEKLADNSYWAKGGAETGYGAKAQEVLGQVKGRGFRHEKTKKKRGSYRGGVIDLQSHSVKFNYSDED
ncbi:nucleolar and coiled-body phosphoprotein 1-like isoform X2 [Cucurbita maxima]|uniref:Nucleolar and coiled-body phosphoprotein 1-like isoform X2 n=1 Tax=Cucurbita maxima TaxID=3661 RepID=A0A6J1JJ58_CUCMA|nr:nucleolar and coiled-body phosphoprotein 1-like isoform X2 [Cucurbita maxima]